VIARRWPSQTRGLAAGSAAGDTVFVPDGPDLTYTATYQPLPIALAIYTCRCGASGVSHDLRRLPHGWIHVDGEPACPGHGTRSHPPPVARTGVEPTA
jgi:hypothetical protein